MIRLKFYVSLIADTLNQKAGVISLYLTKPY